MEILCAATAGVLGRLPCHPLDTIKTVAFTGHYDASNAGRGPSSVLDVARGIYKSGGIRGFYRGVGIAVGGAAPGNVLYLLTYDHAKKYGDAILTQYGYGGSGAAALLHLTCGFLAEAASCAVWVPVDVMKERQQSQSKGVAGRYRNSWDAFRTIAQHESFWGLYRGYWSTLGSFGPFSAVYFLSLEFFDGLHKYPHTETNGSWFFAVSLVHAAAANIVASLTTNPLEMVKTRLQVQRTVLIVDGKATQSSQFSYRYGGLLQGIASVIRDEGVRALWRGSTARILYACPNSALTMALYRSLKEWQVSTSTNRKS